jgi:uncharacterized protein YggE
MKPSFVLGITLSLLLTTAASASDWAPQPHLKVAGEATLTLDADRVDIHSSFTSDHQNSHLALQELESRFGNLLRSLRRQLPETARLEAGQVRVHPRHKRNNDEWQVIGYTATRDLTVLDLPVEKTGEWVEKITQGQPNKLGPLNYHSTQATHQRNPALEQAITDAHNKAKIMAATLGQQLGKALQVEEISSPGIQARSAVMVADSSRESTPEMQPGRVETSARVQVIFELLD